MAYKKNTTRVNIKFINGITNEIIMEIPNRSVIEIGEVLTDSFISRLMESNKIDVECVRVLIVGDFFKQ